MIDLTAISTVQFWIFLQVLVRVSALVAVAPVFGEREIPAQVKIWVTVLLSAVITPLVRTTFPVKIGVPDNLYDMAGALVLQALIGLLMGFAASLILAAFQFAGSLLDIQIGFSLAQTLDPNTQALASPIGQFQYFYGLLLFLLANGHHLLIQALIQSFKILPAGALYLSRSGFLKLMTKLTYDSFVNGMEIAAPVVVVLMIVDMSFSFLSRAMPQLNVFYVGMPVKILAGMAVLIVVLPAIALFAGQLVSGQPQMFTDLLREMRRA